MSKLRADITWKHRMNTDSPIITPLNIITNIEEENNNNEKEVEENLEINEESLIEDSEEEEDNDLEGEFSKYLQGWSEMLEEETYEFEENENEIVHIKINDILHPAIDSNAKWKLSSLFKELEFLF
jgi:hypothetical protein